MKTILSLFFASLLILQAHAQSFESYAPVRHYVFPMVHVEGIPGLQPSQIDRLNKQKIIYHYAYTSCFDTGYNLPIWVSHHLNQSLLVNNFNTRPGRYPQDPHYPALIRDAFSGSGYDHGHLAPAADFTWSREAYNQSFFMTNMSPQHACFNQKGWCHLESTVRKWVEEHPDDDFYIVSGAVTTTFIDTLCITDHLRVYVPEYFYKVIMILSPHQDPRSIGYIIPNHDIDNYSIQAYAVTVDSVQTLTGLDFFNFVPRTLQQAAESTIPEVTYYYTHITCANAACESLYRRRTTPSARTTLRCNH